MPHHASLQDLLTLCRLARERSTSPLNYRRFQEHQGHLLVGYLRAHSIVLEGRSVLDLGAGQGGYSIALHAAGADVVTVDLDAEATADSSRRVTGDGGALPFAAGQFDLVVCASLIEHVAKPRLLLTEIWRVLRSQGYLYLSFPPYYSLRGGHQFSPYHLLGERWALRLAGRGAPYHGSAWLRGKYPHNPKSFAEAYGTWGLYPMTIRKARRELASLPFAFEDQSTRWAPFDLSKVALLGEIATWHVQFLLRKH